MEEGSAPGWHCPVDKNPERKNQGRRSTHRETVKRVAPMTSDHGNCHRASDTEEASHRSALLIFSGQRRVFGWIETKLDEPTFALSSANLACVVGTATIEFVGHVVGLRVRRVQIGRFDLAHNFIGDGDRSVKYHLELCHGSGLLFFEEVAEATAFWALARWHDLARRNARMQALNFPAIALAAGPCAVVAADVRRLSISGQG
jgi:hypothetical protein